MRRLRQLVLLAIGGFLFLLTLVPVPVTVTGPAVIRHRQRLEVATEMMGSVSEVLARGGERVSQGQLLVRLSDHGPMMELGTIADELQRRVLAILREPSTADSASIVHLYTDRAKLLGHLQHIQIRAPVDGILIAVGVRVGQSLAAGDVVATMAPVGADEFAVLALVPGHARPYLAREQEAYVQVAGHALTRIPFRIGDVAPYVSGATALENYLPVDIDDVVPDDRASVIVTGALPKATFVDDGLERAFTEGLRASVSISLGTRTLWQRALARLRGGA